MPTAVFPPLNVAAFFLVAVRVTAALMAAPVVGSRLIPAPMRIGLGLMFAVVLTPIVPLTSMPTTIPAYAFAVAREVLLGLLAGFGVHLTFMIVQMAAGLVGLQMSLSLASMIDPITAEQDTVLERFMMAFATLIFLQVDGLQLFLIGLQRLFVALPVGGMDLPARGAENLILLMRETLGSSVRMAMSMLGALLLADVGLAIAARTVPQMNLFAVGIPAKLALGFVTLGLCLPPTANQLAELFRRLPIDMGALVR